MNIDGAIDIIDLATVAAAFNTSPPSDPYADLNSDGIVDILDLVLAGGNYDKESITDVSW